MKKIILGIVGILSIPIIFFLLQTATLDPAAYTPPDSQALTGVLSANNLLQRADLLALGKVSCSTPYVEVDKNVYASIYGNQINHEFYLLKT